MVFIGQDGPTLRFTLAKRTAIWEPSGSHLGAIWESSGSHLGVKSSGDLVIYRMELADLAIHPIKHNILRPPRGPKLRQTSRDLVFYRMESAPGACPHGRVKPNLKIITYDH